MAPPLLKEEPGAMTSASSVSDSHFFAWQSKEDGCLYRLAPKDYCFLPRKATLLFVVYDATIEEVSIAIEGEPSKSRVIATKPFFVGPGQTTFKEVELLPSTSTRFSAPAVFEHKAPLVALVRTLSIQQQRPYLMFSCSWGKLSERSRDKSSLTVTIEQRAKLGAVEKACMTLIRRSNHPTLQFHERWPLGQVMQLFRDRHAQLQESDSRSDRARRQQAQFKDNIRSALLSGSSIVSEAGLMILAQALDDQEKVEILASTLPDKAIAALEDRLLRLVSLVQAIPKHQRDDFLGDDGDGSSGSARRLVRQRS